MDRRKLTKNDLPAVKARAKELSREHGAAAVKESLALFKSGVPFGYFEDGELIGWKVVDSSTKKVVSACGVGSGTASHEPVVADPDPDPGSLVLPKVNPRKYGDEELGHRAPAVEETESLPVVSEVRGALDDLAYADEAYDYPLSEDESMLSLSDEDDLSMIDMGTPTEQSHVPAHHHGKVKTSAKDVPELTSTVVAPTPGGKGEKKMNPAVTAIVVILVLAILAAAGFAAYRFASGLFENLLPQPAEQADDTPDYDSYEQIPANGIVHVQVTSGSTVSDIRLKLCEAGLPDIAREFASTATNMGADAAIQAGDYIVRGDETASELVKRMVDCDRVPDGVFGVNEGDDIDDIVSAVSAANVTFDVAAFAGELRNPYAYASEFRMLSALPDGLPSLEGFIPTGEFNLHGCSDAHAAVAELLSHMEGRYEQSGLEPAVWKDVLTKASLIEKEALFDEDRPLIASVIENRLAAGMELQIDASVKYANNSDEARVMYDQLEVDSPYNTYMHVGLPIGPICSGISEESIAAALNPVQTDFMFYVLKDKEGHHEFVVTVDEFAAAKQRYLDLYGYEDSW